MLVLSRKVNEVVFIGNDISVKILKVGDGDVVSLGFEAPKDVSIWREELTQPGVAMPKRAVKKAAKFHDESVAKKSKTSEKIMKSSRSSKNFPYKY